MKIVVKSHDQELDKRFYDEFLFIAAFHKRIRNNPKKKARGLSINYAIGLGVCICYILFFASFIFWSGYTVLDYALIGVIMALIFIYIKGLIAVKKRLKLYLENKEETIFEITKNEVKIEKKNQKLQLDWDSIEKVLVNKYSVVFLPKDETMIMIGISTEYKDPILEE